MRDTCSPMFGGVPTDLSMIAGQHRALPPALSKLWCRSFVHGESVDRALDKFIEDWGDMQDRLAADEEAAELNVGDQWQLRPSTASDRLEIVFSGDVVAGITSDGKVSASAFAARERV